MSDEKFLTTDEVALRYRGEVSVGTLENWRAQRLGPPFVKIGKAVLYPVEELDAWDRRNLVTCDDGKVEGRRRRARANPLDGSLALEGRCFNAPRRHA
jgi:hypothetical protein